jgi:hypothetical protein
VQNPAPQLNHLDVAPRDLITDRFFAAKSTVLELLQNLESMGLYKQNIKKIFVSIWKSVTAANIFFIDSIYGNLKN